MHMIDVAVAIPAALVLAIALRGLAARIVAVLALALLAVPWILPSGSGKSSLCGHAFRRRRTIDAFEGGHRHRRRGDSRQLPLPSTRSNSPSAATPFPSAVLPSRVFRPTIWRRSPGGAYVGAIGNPALGWLLIQAADVGGSCSCAVRRGLERGGATPPQHA